MQQLREELAKSYFNQMSGAMQNVSPEDMQRMKDMFAELNDMLGVRLTRIGQVKRGKGVSLLGADGKPIKIDAGGFDHFRDA